MKYVKTFEQANLSQTELNAILDKISDTGLDSLSNHERELLDNYDNPDFDKEEEAEKHDNKHQTAKEITDVVGLTVKDHELKKDIGRYIKFKNLTEKGGLAKKHYIFEIVSVQKHWGRDDGGNYVPNIIGYRVARVGKNDDFGTVGAVKKVEFVNMTEEEAIEHNEKAEEIIRKKLGI